jgi:hypothetical protein
MKPSLMFAGGYVIFSLIFLLIGKYLIGVDITFSSKWLILQLVIMIVVMVGLGRKFFRIPGEELEYGNALLKVFTGTLIGTTIATVIMVAVYNNDLEYQATYDNFQKETNISTAGFVTKMLGQTEEQIQLAKDDARAKIESGELKLPEFPMKWNNLHMMLLMGILNSFIYSLLAAIFVKRKRASFS